MSVQYRELYDEGRRVLEAVPIPDAALDARLLLEEACGTDLQTLLVYPDRPVEDEMSERYRALIGRRRRREPTAMILGEWEFMGLPFKVTKDTLIPEQDTEVLVEAALARMGSAQGLPFGQSEMRTSLSCRRGSSRGSGADTEDGNRPGGPDGMRTVRILDLCTGSGCILLSLLHFLPQADGIGTDISEGALSVAAENAKTLGLSGRALFYQGDLWNALPRMEDGLAAAEHPEDGMPVAFPAEGPYAAQEIGAAGRFDLIVSNPPYVPTPVIPTLEPEVRCGEPYAALDGGADGLDFYRRIIPNAPRYLKKGGLLVLEAGFDEAADIRAMMERAGFTQIRIDKDCGGLDRVVSGEYYV